MPWQPLSLKLQWPPYFRADPDEEKKRSEQTAADLEAGLITLETAVRRIAPMYGVEDVDAYVEQLKEEKAERMGGLHKALANLNAANGRATQAQDGSGDGPIGGGTSGAAGATGGDDAGAGATDDGKRRKPNKTAR